MKKNTKRIALLSAFFLLITGAMVAVAGQENNLIIPHEHDYQIVAFEEGVVTFRCEDCDAMHTEDFADHINEDYEPLDVVADGIVNAKDYAYLLQHYGADWEGPEVDF